MNVMSSDRPGAAANPASLPLLLLLLALSTVFLFGNDRDHFYRPGHHDGISVHSMAVGVNLSPEHNFLRFSYQTLDRDGLPSYVLYSRFPVGGYVAIKLATLPFGNDLTKQIYAARMLMLLFFAGAAVLAYLAVFRLASNQWIALTTTLLTCSSYYCLYYNDAVAPEGMIDLFGVMLTFHGMVVFVQEVRFRQLLVKACVALLLGWHVLALLLPFVVLGLAGELLLSGSSNSLAARLSVARVRAAATALLSSRYLILGVVALLFGSLLLIFNFASEYFALNGETPLTELPSVKSMLKRTGLNQTFNANYTERLAWLPFLEGQFYRIGGMSLPYSLPGYVGALGQSPAAPGGSQGVVMGLVVSGACVLGLVFARHKLLLATLVLSGFCWALPMRHNTFAHDFESLFYIGIPLVFFVLALLYIRKLSSDRLIVGLSVAALLAFVMSNFQMGRVGYDTEAANVHAAVIADFAVIRRLTGGKTVFVSEREKIREKGFDDVSYSTLYYLHGSTILNDGDQRGRAEFLVTDERQEGRALLTPQNRRVFLYDRAGHDWYAEFGDP